MLYIAKGNMTREFNNYQRYDSRPPYRSSTSNHRYGAIQPSQPAKPRVNRAMVDRAWVNGAPHRHADYKTRQSHEAGAHERQQPQKFGHHRQQSEYSLHNRSPYERETRNNDQRFSHHSSRPQYANTFSNRYPGQRQHPNQDVHTFTDQRGKGPEDNTYQGRNNHPNFNRRRYNQETEQLDRQTNKTYAYRTNPSDHRHNGEQQRPRDYQTHPYNRDERYNQRDRFSDRREHNHSRPSFPPTPPARPSWERNRTERYERRDIEQFKGDYEQFNHSSINQLEHPKKHDRRQHTPQTHAHQTAPPIEHHVTRLPDGRVMKGPRPAQRKNAQFWTEIANDADELVKHAQQPTQQTEATQECAQTTPLPTESHLPTARPTSSRAKTAQRAAARARKEKTNKPASNGPRPSQRGFKWPTPPARAAD
jgi:hypothetical protein